MTVFDAIYEAVEGRLLWFGSWKGGGLTHLCPPLRSTFAVRETASLGIVGEPRVPPLSPSESIVLSEHNRL